MIDVEYVDARLREISDLMGRVEFNDMRDALFRAAAALVEFKKALIEKKGQKQ